jgi:hypothetical protein
MMNQIRSTIGALALMAASAFGSVTNSPHITKFERTCYASRDKIGVTATNFNNGAAFNLYKSTNLKDWFKVGGVVYSGTDPTKSVFHSYSETNGVFRNGCDYFLSTTNVSSFRK